MPELPEVETVKNDLQKKIVKAKILAVEVSEPALIKNISVDDFSGQVQNETIQMIKRRGKYLLFLLFSGKIVVVHLRMTGQLVCCKKEEPKKKHLYVIFSLMVDGVPWELRYYDVRKFGCFYFLQAGESLSSLEKLGIEPFSPAFNTAYLKEKLDKKKQKIKALLLDQTVIAGIGNIYADEILFRAGILPERAGESLCRKEIESLCILIPAVLQEAVEQRGTTISDYRDGMGKKGQFQNFLKVYGRTGEACCVCSTPLMRIKIAGRNSTFCPSCQK